ncbi:glycosyltransferase family 4 protein [Tateyamaria armeniaca]|uniref:Glycosyltransferase family 4 protein n=1 Tax=Tateyamaria armeniaca TaxID=2518930 RepID=A0ABW8UZA3_9RHOB
MSSSWIGGQNYVFNLVSTYRAARPDRKIFLVSSFDTVPDILTPLVDSGEVVVLKVPELNALRSPVVLARILLRGFAPDVSQKIQAAGITHVFSPTLYLGRRPGITVITWIPDFQHRFLPHLFSRARWWMREFSYRLCARSANRIILSSFDAKQSYQKMAPDQPDKAVVVPFTPTLDPLKKNELAKILAEHDLDAPFIYLPNQFWKHKNHMLVITALEALVARGWDGLLVITGSGYDHRDQAYVETLKARLAKMEEKGSVRMLGQVPREHVLAFLQCARCLINPSLFEGRSSTVEEAIALGTPMILSDLPVHREQAGDMAKYFDPADPEALSELIAQVPLERGDTATPDHRTELADGFAARQAKFATQLCVAIEGPQAGI